MTFTLINRYPLYTTSFSFISLDLPFSKYLPSLSKSLALYFVFLHSNVPHHMLLLTRTCALHLCLLSPYSNILSAQFQTSRINHQIHSQSHTIIRDQVFQTSMTRSSSNFKCEFPGSAAWNSMFIKVCLPSQPHSRHLFKLCIIRHHHLTPSFITCGDGGRK